MVKKKGSREMNPADAHRKAQRAKEIARNKKERRFQRDAHSLQSNPDAIKDELKEVLALEEDGKGNQTVRLKKKALQGAYDNAIKKKKEEELKRFQPIDELNFSTSIGHGVLERQAADSVYYHPTLNPTGKPQRYKTSAPASGSALATLPKPKPPPLPLGPAPHQAQQSFPLPPPTGPPPTDAQPLSPPAGPQPGVDGRGSNGSGLPPPAGPPPGYRPMMPPMGPPPRMMPPGMHPHMFRGVLPPPNMPPPGYAMPPPAGPPPGVQQRAAQQAPPQAEHKDAKPTIQAASTVVKIPRAEQDKSVTCMVPASLRVRRDSGPAAKPKKASFSTAPSAAPKLASDFGLAPSAAPAVPLFIPPRRPTVGSSTGGGFDKKYEDFMSEMAGLGALSESGG